MKTILIARSVQTQNYFQENSKGIFGLELRAVFEGGQGVLEYVKNYVVETIFIDIPLEDEDVFLLIKKVREVNSRMVITAILGDDRYFSKALQLKVDYFLTAAYKKEDVLDAVERARCLVWRQKKRVYFRTFGRFDLFIDGKAIHIKNAKAKELLALCIDHRGGIVTMDEAVDKLWENRAYDDKVKNLYRRAIMDIREILKRYHAEHVFFIGRGVCGINYAEVECDYFYFVENRMKGSHTELFLGDYLCEYSWAEETVARLANILRGDVHNYTLK